MVASQPPGDRRSGKDRKLTSMTIREPRGGSDAEVDVGGAPSGEPEVVLLQEDLLLEEISIDGMCGVY
jgi:mycofactocin precursor